MIDTPQYLSGLQTLSGFFFEIPVSTFQKAIPLLQEKFPTMSRFVYLAGSSRVAIFTSQEQTFYLNIASSDLLQKQFQKYDTLSQRYQDFDQLLSVDLGALDETKVIVRKK